jgi:hypothetical protein
MQCRYMPRPMTAKMNIAHVDGSGTAVNEPASESGPHAIGVMVSVELALMVSELTVNASSCECRLCF